MKVLALVGALDHVCYRYRIEAFAWALAEQGLFLEALPLERHPWRRFQQLRSLGHADLVLLQRKLLPLHQLRILRRAAKCLVYDVDDAVFQRESYSGKSPASWQRMLLYWSTVYAADAVLTGNHYLRRQTTRFVEPQRVHVVPTCVEPDRYQPLPHFRQGGDARLIWIGQRSTLPSLACCGPQLSAAARAVPGLGLRVICDHYPELPDLRVVARPWSSETEAEELAQGDIGINWLPDDDWSRGKCGLKVLQFMAAGLPVVANPVGMNREMVLHGRTGLLASTPEEWARAIGRLASDPSLRQRLGEAGRRLVCERFSVESWGAPFARLLRAIAERRPVEQVASLSPTPLSLGAWAETPRIPAEAHTG